MPYRDLNLLQASESAADRLSQLIDSPAGRRLLYVRQMRDAVQSISANIVEGFGRGEEPDRARFLKVARGSSQETIEHLRANFSAGRIHATSYWPIRNLLVVTVKMLNSFLRSRSSLGLPHATPNYAVDVPRR